jgi:hypothetical protein
MELQCQACGCAQGHPISTAYSVHGIPFPPTLPAFGDHALFGCRHFGSTDSNVFFAEHSGYGKNPGPGNLDKFELANPWEKRCLKIRQSVSISYQI